MPCSQRLGHQQQDLRDLRQRNRMEQHQRKLPLPRKRLLCQQPEPVRRLQHHLGRHQQDLPRLSLRNPLQRHHQELHSSLPLQPDQWHLQVPLEHSRPQPDHSGLLTLQLHCSRLERRHLRTLPCQQCLHFQAGSLRGLPRWKPV